MNINGQRVYAYQPGYGFDPLKVAQGKVTTEDVALANDACDILQRHYPGWPWAVNAEIDQGVVSIFNVLLHQQWGYRVHLGQADTTSAWQRAIITAGGELLERWGIPRGPYSAEAYAMKRSDMDVIMELKAEGRRR